MYVYVQDIFLRISIQVTDVSSVDAYFSVMDKDTVLDKDTCLAACFCTVSAGYHVR